MIMIMKPSNNDNNNKQAAANEGLRRLLCLVGLLSVAISGVAGASQTKAASATTSGRSVRSSSSLSPSPSSSSSSSASLAASVANEQQKTSAAMGKGDHLEAVASEAQQESIPMPQMTMATNIANAKVQLNNPNDMTPAAGSHYGKSHGGGKYYMYVESPKKGAYKMGYKRGNGKHMIMGKASVHKSHVSAYYKWHDKKGKGSHKFEFKHSDKKGKKYY